MKSKDQFILMTAAEFKTWLFNQKFTRKIKLIQQHCTWKPDYSNFHNNHFELLQGMKNYHVNERKFSDIAQNITIFPDGMVAVCRPFDVAPAGIKGANHNGVCIENLGNFDKGGDTMTTEQEQAILSVTAALCERFSLLPGIDIVYHAWYNRETGVRDNAEAEIVDINHKTCPGTAFFGGNSYEAFTYNFVPKVAELI